MKEKLLKDSVFKIGRVISVEGRTVKVEVDRSKNSSYILFNGETIKNVSVNSYIKITKGFTKIIGKVEGESIIEDKFFSEKPYVSEKKKIKRILIVKLLGFFKGNVFERGLKELPLINNDCFIVDRDEFKAIHSFVKHGDHSLVLGTQTQDNEQEIAIGVNDLFASHIGIFGNTGSGKSYTLAKTYHEVIKKYWSSAGFKQNAKFLLFDFNGEYNEQNSITGNKFVYNLSTRLDSPTNRLPLSEKDLLNKEIFSILSNATEKTQKPFIARTLEYYEKVMSKTPPINYFKGALQNTVIEIYKMSDKQKADSTLKHIKQFLPISYDSNGLEIPYDSDVEFHNTSSEFKIKNSQTFLRQSPDRILSTLLYKKVDEYNFHDDFIMRMIQFMHFQLIQDIIKNRAQEEHIAPTINKLKSYGAEISKVLEITEHTDNNFWRDNIFCVVNLNNVSITIKKILPLLISYKLYADHKELNKVDKAKSLNIIIDEAHNILSYSSQRESETWKDYRLEIFEEIIKEGRKFGVFLTIASQRPSDISPTIISQLHNFFLHRLINNNDIQAVEKTISYLDKISFESLPILPTGTCIIAGLCVQIPVMVDVGKLDETNEPDNKTIKLTDYWT